MRNPTNEKKLTFRHILDYLICLLAFVVLNLVVFHTGLYHEISLVESFGGNAYGRISVLEELETEHNRKVIALVGDSTTEEGLGARELSQITGKPVANLALPGAGPLEWFYFLRSIDADRNRFETIVITMAPSNMRSRPHEDGFQTLMAIAPVDELIRYALESEDSNQRTEYAYASVDRIFGHRKDLAHLFLSPNRLLTIREQKAQQLSKLRFWPGENFDVCRVIYNPRTGKVRAWRGIRDPIMRMLSKNALRRSAELNRRPSVSGIVEPLEEIINYYNGSSTNIILLSIPFGLIHDVKPRADAVGDYYRKIEEFSTLPNVTHWNAVHEPLFKDCKNFYDFRHLNTRGRKLLTSLLGAKMKTLLQD